MLAVTEFSDTFVQFQSFDQDNRVTVRGYLAYKSPQYTFSDKTKRVRGVYARRAIQIDDLYLFTFTFTKKIKDSRIIVLVASKILLVRIHWESECLSPKK